MKIEKFIHSCLRLTVDGQQMLFDPGKFSFASGELEPAALRGSQIVVITHDHPDHLDLDALGVIASGADTTVVCNPDVAKKLHGLGLTIVEMMDETRRFGAFELRAIPVRHTAILSTEIPSCSAFLVNDQLLNTSDTFDPALYALSGVEVLALPVMAPYLTELKVFEFACTIRPTHVVPLHDGHAHEFFLKQRYKTYGEYFARQGIRFHPMPEIGDAFTLYPQ